MRWQIANEARSVELAINISYPICTSVIQWKNCFIKNNQEMLLDLTDFVLQEQPEDNLMVANSRAWYNGSCYMYLDFHSTKRAL